MKRSRVLAILVCLAALGCDEDPARAVKIMARPATPAPPPAPAVSASAAPAATNPAVAAAPSLVEGPPNQEWRPPGCPPPPEDSDGPSSLAVTGPCTFQHRGSVDCESTADDFIVTMSRKAARGATLMVYINVEKYHGPGSYDGAQMFVGVQDKTAIYRWSSDEVAITVGPDEAFATLPTTKIDAEAQLTGCTGPMTNYQCGGYGSTSKILDTTEVVSGTLSCKKK